MALQIDLRATDDLRDAVHRTVQALAEGQLVALPTETTYGVAASALHGDAVAQLARLCDETGGDSLTLAIHGDDALDYSPRMNPLASRLSRRCWPGPLTLIVDGSHADSAVGQLPASVQQAVAPQGSIGLQVPGHPFVQSVLQLIAGPLVLAGRRPAESGQPHCGADMLREVGDRVAIVVDDGPCKFAQPSTVAEVVEDHLRLVREGVISESQLRRLSSFLIMFVCTGNTCRSPMAAALMRRRLAERAGCEVDELESRGVMVLSAGIAAANGSAASPEAVSTMAELKIDLTDHGSQPLSERLARFADAILTMTRGHRQAIVTQWPEISPHVHLLCHDQQDVGDPIGGPAELYERCAAQIDAQLPDWIEQFHASGLRL